MEDDAIPSNSSTLQPQENGEIGKVRVGKLPPKGYLPAPPGQDNDCEIYAPPLMCPLPQAHPCTNPWAKMIALNEQFPEDAMEEDTLREVMMHSYRLIDNSPKKKPRDEVEFCALNAEILGLRPDEATHRERPAGPLAV